MGVGFYLARCAPVGYGVCCRSGARQHSLECVAEPDEKEHDASAPSGASAGPPQHQQQQHQQPQQQFATGPGSPSRRPPSYGPPASVPMVSFPRSASAGHRLSAELSDWLTDAEECIATCLTGIDVLLRISSKYANAKIPMTLLQECKARLVRRGCNCSRNPPHSVLFILALAQVDDRYFLHRRRRRVSCPRSGFRQL